MNTSAVPVPAFAGIDLAIAKKKRLPIAICVIREGCIVPLTLVQKGAPLPPRGHGNVGTLDDRAVAQFVGQVVDYLRQAEKYFNVRIQRIAIDAPSGPRREDLNRRRAEKELDRRGISCFTTPTAVEMSRIRDKAAAHLRIGGAQSRIPHANQLWMIVGFALFERLRKEWECLEVFPQATVCVLGANAIHKSQPDGVSSQLATVARCTGWPEPIQETALKHIAYGPRHDVLDAYLSAWIAALDPTERAAIGDPPDDVIWVPAVGAVGLRRSMLT